MPSCKKCGVVLSEEQIKKHEPKCKGIMDSRPKFRKNEYGFDGVVIVVEHPDGSESTELWTFADLAIAIDKFKSSHTDNRKCKRCGIVQNSDLMHYNKQQGWLCNDRRRCNVVLEGTEQKKDKPWKRLYTD